MALRTDPQVQTSIGSSQELQQFMPPLSLANLHSIVEKGILEKGPIPTRFYGWILRTRVGGGGRLAFIDIYDGTCVGALMGIASDDYYVGEAYQPSPDSLKHELTDSESFKTLSFEQLVMAEHLSDGCAVVIDGVLVKPPPSATQTFEFQIHRLRKIGGVEDPMTYPIQKSSVKQLATLRQYPFMRIRAQALQSIFRICSKAELGVHMFMDEEGVEKLDPNIITMSDCEGAGETFKIAPLMFSRDAEGKEIPVGLTVSSQLPLESGITGLKQVYTAQKSFRAEKSDTIKHLAEFFHVEYEGAFITLKDLMDFTERFVKAVIKYVHKRCKADFDFLESKFAPTDVRPTRELLEMLVDRPFIRIKHCDAVKLIHKIVREKMELPDDDGKMKRVKLDKLPKEGEDVSSEHEKLLVKYFGWTMLTEEERAERLAQKKEFGAFVFLTHWPLKIKSFYMKQCDDESGECESFDLLAPRVGEMFGGSMREWRFEKLDTEVKRRGMDLRPIQWFIDLRKSGSMPHGGWGMGFARFCCLLTGAPSVRDTVFLPVYYGHCPY
ncbi:hypothetical protein YASMINEVIRUS_325 [Yasminevirus sp. GU-2018]|uniref:Aminoacyl-transfer RNA synthetases class-II family profile domain-containing protein n=1 Tax=Yasminevirus sp. GU-2018 TaxID=2420051 RepID=A0A5K0U8Y2_9VIRU|nr:hypothetical protein YASMINEVIRUS_325 [Yasminevirus sp. GU-2018]